MSGLAEVKGGLFRVCCDVDKNQNDSQKWMSIVRISLSVKQDHLGANAEIVVLSN